MKGINWKNTGSLTYFGAVAFLKKSYMHENGRFLEKCHLLLPYLGKNNEKMNNQSLSLSKPMSLNLSNYIRQKSNLRQADLAVPACAEGKLQHRRSQIYQQKCDLIGMEVSWLSLLSLFKAISNYNVLTTLLNEGNNKYFCLVSGLNQAILLWVIQIYRRT